MFPPDTSARQIYVLIINGGNFLQRFKPALDRVETLSKTLTRYHFSDGTMIEADTSKAQTDVYYVNSQGQRLDDRGYPIVQSVPLKAQQSPLTQITGLTPATTPSASEPSTADSTPLGNFSQPQPITDSPQPSIPLVDPVIKLLDKTAANLGLNLSNLF